MTAHSILTQVRPSEEQLRAVTAAGHDTIVVAGAGAGKTRALVARYLSLLENGIPLRSIVAITFTIKAAREMRNRIRDEITRFAASPELPEALRQTWQSHAGVLDAARISTIHSLCGDILRSHPAEAGLDPRFIVFNPADVARVREVVLDEVMSWAADDPLSLPLFDALGVGGLRSALAALLDRRLDTRECMSHVRLDPLAHWRGLLEGGQRAALRLLMDDPDWTEAARTVRIDSGVRADDKLEEQRRVAASALNAFYAASELRRKLDALLPLGTVRWSNGRASCWPGPAIMAEVRHSLETLHVGWKRFAVLGVQLSALDESLAAILPPLFTLFEGAEARYTALKEAQQALDFDDLEARSLALLEGDPAVCARWQSEVSALLVDEYQDTNARQNRLVRLLAPPAAGKLFIVGDAKQAIYGFRGADVTVFREEQKAHRGRGWDGVTLDDSYRAHPGLLHLLNALMEPVLGNREDPLRPWREPFRPLKPQRPEPCPGFVEPHMELLLSAGTKGDGALYSAARALAARLIQLVDGGQCAIEEDKRFRPLRWDDIAILCRSSYAFAAYEAAFEEAGVPFLTVAGGGFYDRPEIRDLLNALDAIADPTNDLALAGLLRSPAFGVSDSGLFRLAQAHKAAGAADLWQTLQTQGASLPGGDGPRAAHAAAQIAALHAQAGRLTVAALLKNLLDATAYTAALVAAGQSRSARNVDKLLSDATNSGLVSVGDFLEYIRGVRETGVREGEARAADERAVQIMTVHAAKGLEFPIVVIGDAGSGGAGRASQVLIDEDFGPVIALKDAAKAVCTCFTLADAARKEREQAESDRLLYVAATRAREKLIISGCISFNKDGGISARGWLKQLLGEPCLGITHLHDGVASEDGASINVTIAGQGVRCRIATDYPAPVRAASTAPAPPAPVPLPLPLLAPVVAEAVPAADEKTHARARREWRVVPPDGAGAPRWAPSWVVGILVHEALSTWRFDGPGLDDWLLARARERGLAGLAQLDNAVTRARRLLARFRGSPLYAEMDGAVQRLHEVPYQALAGDHGENGSIDALYLPQGESGWRIVEFKTDYVASEHDPLEWLEGRGYLAQAQRYGRAVENLLGSRPRGTICLLNHAQGVRLIEIPDV